MTGEKGRLHRGTDGRPPQTNKTSGSIKMKQRDRIAGWIYEEYRKFAAKKGDIPDREEDAEIIDAVLQKAEDAGFWISADEIYSYYDMKKPFFQAKVDDDGEQKFRRHAAFFKSIIDQERCPVVICDMQHEIIYMNPAAVRHYETRGGERLIGQSILACHSAESGEKIRRVVEWFAESPEHNLVYTFHNEKQSKDVYMVALRDEGELIGYYEKHEFRTPETMKLYDLT